MSVETVGRVKRFFKILGGFTLLLAGAIMIFTPGPGWAVIFMGLAVLAAEYVWARRLLNRLKTQSGRIRDAILPVRHQKRNSSASCSPEVGALAPTQPPEASRSLAPEDTAGVVTK